MSPKEKSWRFWAAMARAHQRVTDGSGQVPQSYQHDYLDPRGRVIGVSLRKVF